MHNLLDPWARRVQTESKRMSPWLDRDAFCLFLGLCELKASKMAEYPPKCK